MSLYCATITIEQRLSFPLERPPSARLTPNEYDPCMLLAMTVWQNSIVAKRSYSAGPLTSISPAPRTPDLSFPSLVPLSLHSHLICD